MLMFYSIRIRISFFFNSLQKQKPFPRHQYRFFYKLHIMVGFITPILFFASNKRLRKYTTEEVYPIHQQRNKISLAIKTDETDGKECIELQELPKPESFSEEIGERYLNLQSQNKGQWKRRHYRISRLLRNAKHIVHDLTLLYWASRLSIMIALFFGFTWRNLFCDHFFCKIWFSHSFLVRVRKDYILGHTEW